MLGLNSKSVVRPNPILMHALPVNAPPQKKGGPDEVMRHSTVAPGATHTLPMRGSGLKYQKTGVHTPAGQKTVVEAEGVGILLFSFS